MILAWCIALSAVFMELLGSVMGVIGFGSFFGHHWIAIALSIALDCGKITGVMFLYKEWKHISVIQRVYMPIAVIIMIGISSWGAFSFLSQQYENMMTTTSKDGVIVESLINEKARLQARKIEIDAQISNVAPDRVTQKRQLIASFNEEHKTINRRLAELDKEIPALQSKSIDNAAEVGSILFIQKTFGIDREIIIKWYIFIIVTVFNPFAIFLIIAANHRFDRLSVDNSSNKITVNAPHEIDISPIKFDPPISTHVQAPIIQEPAEATVAPRPSIPRMSTQKRAAAKSVRKVGRPRKQQINQEATTPVTTSDEIKSIFDQRLDVITDADSVPDDIAKTPYKHLITVYDNYLHDAPVKKPRKKPTK